ncbi:MAG: PIG-L family deacetylase [Polyangiaceae bacterium]
MSLSIGEQLRPVRDIVERIASQRDVDALLVFAHPDDEAIAVGGHLWCWPSANLVYLTQGAPRDPSFAFQAGCIGPAAYAQLRAEERNRALEVANVFGDRCVLLGRTDQEACWDLLSLVREVYMLIERFHPEVIVTHPYEGGHPDHDSAAFVVQTACDWHDARNKPVPIVIETPFYHRYEGRLRTGEFLPGSGGEEYRMNLDAHAQEMKRAMFHAHRSQHVILSGFPTDYECFRVAPRYDFRLPPHGGPLHYETLGWAMTGETFRDLAEKARAALADEPFGFTAPAAPLPRSS